jgi:hypothetical protein
MTTYTATIQESGSVNKEKVYDNLNQFLKAIQSSRHGWVFLDSVQATTDKRIRVEDTEITIYTNHVYPIESTEYGYDHTINHTGISLDYGDFDNFKNFLTAHKPDKLHWETWINNSSDWMRDRNISHETITIQAVKNDKRIPHSEFRANQLYDKRDGPHHYFKMLKTHNFESYKTRLDKVTET